MDLNYSSSECDSDELGGVRPNESEDAKCIKRQIRDSLKPADFSGPFFADIIEERPPNPGLFLEEYGWLSLPFSAQDANALLKHEKSRATAPGIDESCLVYSEREVTCRNPDWSTYLHKVKALTLHQCGIIDECSLSGGKLIICRSEEALRSQLAPSAARPDDAFATLMLSLQSEHCGFEVKFSHDGEEKAIDISQLGIFSGMVAVWVDGVNYTMQFSPKSVIVLFVYDVLWDKAREKPTATGATDGVVKLRDCLQTWTSGLSTLNLPRFLAFRLSQQYEDNSLQPTLLAANDLKCFNLLSQACRDSGCKLYLANFERQIEGDPDGDEIQSAGVNQDIRSIADDSTKIRVCNAEGIVLGNATNVHQLSFLNEGVYRLGRVADAESEDEAEDTFEEYYPDDLQIRHYFRDSALLLIPDRLYPEFQTEYMWDQSPLERVKWVKQAFEIWQRNPSFDSSACFADLCLRIINKLEQQQTTSSRWSNYSYTDFRVPGVNSKEDIIHIIKATMQAKVPGSTEILKKATSLLVSGHVSALREIELDLAAQVAVYVGFPVVSDQISKVIFQHHKLCPILRHLNIFITAYISRLKTVNEDGNQELDQAGQDVTTKWMNDCLLHAIGRANFESHSSPQDLVEFVSDLARHGLTRLFSACTEVLKELNMEASTLFNIFRLSCERVHGPASHTFQEMKTITFNKIEAKLRIELIRAPLLYAIMDHFIDTNDVSLLGCVDSLLASDQMFVANGIPFTYLTTVNDLVRKAENIGTAADEALENSRSSILQYLYILLTVILASYLTFDIGKQPKKGYYFAHPILECRDKYCRACDRLNEFFADTSKRQFVSYKWRVGAERNHAQQQIATQIENPEKCLKQWIDHSNTSRNQPMQLHLQKLNQRFDGKDLQWTIRKDELHNILQDIVSMQKKRSLEQNCFGSLTDILTNFEVQQAQKFIDEIKRSSLRGYRFLFPPEATIGEAQEIRSYIQNRGGKTLLITKEDYEQQRASEPGDLINYFVSNVHDSEGSASAEETVPWINEKELYDMIDRRLCETILARLDFPSAYKFSNQRVPETSQTAGNAANSRKRKAETISRTALGETVNRGEPSADGSQDDADEELYISDTEDDMEGREETRKRARKEAFAAYGKENFVDLT